MGLIKLISNTGKTVNNGVKGVFNFGVGTLEQLANDAFIEYFECTGLNNRTFMCPATQVNRDVGSKGKANVKGTPNLISSGSVFNVAAGQCAILIENGAIHDCVICETDEGAGQYQYISNAEPSWVTAFDTKDENAIGGFVASKSVTESLKNLAGNAMEQFKKRAAAGGQSTNSMYLFYINLKPMLNIPVGAGDIRIRDNNINMTVTMGVHGTVNLKISNPVLFYQNYLYDLTKPFSLTSEDGKAFVTNIKSILTANIKSAVRDTTIKCATNWWEFDNPDVTLALRDNINDLVGQELLDKYGVTIPNVVLESTIDPQILEKLNHFDEIKRLGSDRDMMAAEALLSANKAQEAAAANSAGAAVGFMGMNMAMNTGGMMMNNINNYQPQAQQQMYQQQMQGYPQQQMQGYPQQQMQGYPQQAQGYPQQQMQQAQIEPTTMEAARAAAAGVTSNLRPMGTTKPTESQPTQTAPQAEAESWVCTCGATNKSKFCMECGQPKPAPAPAVNDNTWTCECGAVNTSKFCMDCGKPKPVAVKAYKCDKCGWEPADPTKPPKFCPECGDVFDTNDAQ